MANPIDLSTLILSVARSCDDAIRELKKSNAEVELDQVEMTVTVEADIDDEVLRKPTRPGASVTSGIPGLRLDLRSKILPATRPTSGLSTSGSSGGTSAGASAGAAASAGSASSDVTGKIELRLLLSRKE